LAPSISWRGSAALGDAGQISAVDVEYGFELDGSIVTQGKDLTAAPKSIWGKATKTVKDWTFGLRGEFKNGVYDKAALEVSADAPADLDAGLKVWASATKDNVSVSKVELTKGIDMDDSTRLVVKPRYYVEEEEGELVLAFAKDSTVIEIVATKDDQSITVSQQIDDANRLEPSITRTGAMSLEWERTLGNGNSLTTKFTPNESIGLKWKDSEWTATMNIPIEGSSLGGPTVNIQRDVHFKTNTKFR